MQVQITIDCSNDAFTISPEMELGSILRTLAIKVENGICSMPVMDGNGNKVGELEVTNDEV